MALSTVHGANTNKRSFLNVQHSIFGPCTNVDTWRQNYIDIAVDKLTHV